MQYPPASLIATGITFALLCIGFTGLRFWVRLSYSRTPVGPDDWFITIATVIITVLNILQVFNTIYGQASFQDDNVKRAYVQHQIDYVQRVVETVAFGSLKLSILFFYRRLFGRWSAFKKHNNIIITLIVVWMLVYLFLQVFACGLHPDITWKDRPAADDRCLVQGPLMVSYAATDVVTDIIVIGMPFLYIRRLQISRRQKWAICGIFLLGFLSTLAGIIRLTFISVCYSVGQFTWIPPPLPNPPKVMKVINPIFWTNLELTCGVIAANSLALWPLIRNASNPRPVFSRLLKKVTRSSRDSSRRSSHDVEVVAHSAPEKIRGWL